MNKHETHAELGAATVPRPVVADVSAIGACVSSVRVSNSARPEHSSAVSSSSDANRLLSLARALNLVPVGAPTAPDGAPAEPFRQVVAHIRNPKDKSYFAPTPIVEPIEPCDPALDNVQRDAVVRSMQTPDLLLVQGRPGTGKTRVIAEMVRQAALRGRRVLLAASAGAVDEVLTRLESGPGASVVRLMARDECAEKLPTGVASLTAASQEADRRAEWVRQAHADERAAEALCRQLRETTLDWELIEKLAEPRPQIAAHRAALGEQRADAPEQVRRLGDGDLPASLRQLTTISSERIAELEVQRLDIQKRRGEIEQEMTECRKQFDALRPLDEAGHSGKFWSLQFWKAKLHKSLPESLAGVLRHMEETEQSLADLSAREEALDRNKQTIELEQSAERSRLVEAEIARRQQEIDGAAAELDRQDREDEDQFWKSVRAAPAGMLVPRERTKEAVRACRDEWAQCEAEALRQLALATDRRVAVEREGNALLAFWRRTVSLVAGPVAAVAADAAYSTQPFDLLIADEAHLLSEPELSAIASKARRWVLVGEPAPAIPAIVPSRFAGRNGQARRPRPAPDFFWQLWGALDDEKWARDGMRLIYRLHPVAVGERRLLETEAVADRPEIELRILPNGGEPILAEVAFPANMNAAAAKEYLFHELGEIPCQPRIRTARWEETANSVVFKLGGLADVEDLPLTLNLEDGLSLRTCELASARSREEFILDFRKDGPWDRRKAEAWINERLLKHDRGRTCRLDNNYRQTAALAAWLNEAVGGGRQAGDLASNDGAIQFEPIPRRAPTGPRRGGAGYEIDLADPRQRELLPNDLNAALPNRGFVNLPEAQAVAELLPRLPRNHTIAISAPYSAQAVAIRHYLPNDARVFSCDELAHRECDVLIISLTRSHVSRAVTFGDDPASLARLFTRPRCRLVLIGDPGTLTRRSQWEGAIDHLDEVAGETERRWVNALLHVLPARASHPQRITESIRS